MPASPGFWQAATNWDGQWYATVALHGYPSTLPTLHGLVTQNEWAFYPLYPTLCRVIMELTSAPFHVVAPLFSLACGLLAMIVLYRMLRETASRFSAGATVACLSAFAASPVLQLAYTESLALLLIILTLFAMRRRRYISVMFLVVGLSLTRPVGLAVAATLVILGLVRWRQTPDEFPRRERWLHAWASAVALVSAGLWPAAAWFGTGRVDAYVVTMKGWESYGASGVGPGWILGLAQIHGRNAALGLVGGLLAYLLLLRRRSAGAWGLDLRVWTAVYPLYLFLATAPGVSILRYLTLAIVPFWPMPVIRHPHESVKGRGFEWVLLILILLLGLLCQYVWVTDIFMIRELKDRRPLP